jgi:hypothetical protein
MPLELHLYRLMPLVDHGRDRTSCGPAADQDHGSTGGKSAASGGDATPSTGSVCRPLWSPEGRFASLRDEPPAHPSPDPQRSVGGGYGERPRESADIRHPRSEPTPAVEDNETRQGHLWTSALRPPTQNAHRRPDPEPDRLKPWPPLPGTGPQEGRPAPAAVPHSPPTRAQSWRSGPARTPTAPLNRAGARSPGRGHRHSRKADPTSGSRENHTMFEPRAADLDLVDVETALVRGAVGEYADGPPFCC